MYHSIAAGDSPTCIAPETFRQQMTALKDAEHTVVPLAQVVSALRNEAVLPQHCAALTFDDGFEDFATVAFPELETRGWPATVFLPAGKMGQIAEWKGAHGRRLMAWPTVADLARHGVDFGGHGMRHVELTGLPPKAAAEEIAGSRRLIEDQIGHAVCHFAPPYGRSDASLRAIIKENYQASAGTTLARARPGADLYDLPRIEMWYFRDLHRWRAFLAGKARTYFALRQFLRSFRNLARQ